MESEPKQIFCPFANCQKLVELPPNFDDTLQCSSCGAKYHFELGDDVAEEILNAEENGKEYDYVFVGIAQEPEDEEDEEEVIEETPPVPVFIINYDVKQENLEGWEIKVFVFFTR